MLKSIVEYCAEHEGEECGYCGGSDSNFSHGMWAHSLTVEDYQDLIDRGWRRFGKYCYKPTMDVICCPMYTIRCRALEFKASKSQKKVLKKFNKYLSGEENSSTNKLRKMSTCSSETGEQEDQPAEGVEQFVEAAMLPQNIDVGEVMKCEVTEQEQLCDDANDTVSAVETDSMSKVTPSTTDMKNTNNRDPNKPPCMKAKLLRKERKLEKLKSKGIDVSTLPTNNKNKEKQLEDFISELPEEFKQKLEIKLIRTNPPSAEYLLTAAETHSVYVKYQTTIHNDKPEECTEAKFQEFLIHSPLLAKQDDDSPTCGYGSFHQQYWLDKKLIAVGVIDILPKCVSSVYFFYDPQFMHLTLGTYGALREIEFTRKLQSECPELKYYYMGYYVHMCKKLRYKGNFHPSDLLCPETYKWFPIKDCLPKLEISPYSRLDTDIDNVDQNYPKRNDIQSIPCWVKGTIIPYKVYKKKAKINSNEDEVNKYSELVGGKTIRNMILVRPRIN